MLDVGQHPAEAPQDVLAMSSQRRARHASVIGCVALPKGGGKKFVHGRLSVNCVIARLHPQLPRFCGDAKGGISKRSMGGLPIYSPDWRTVLFSFPSTIGQDTREVYTCKPVASLSKLFVYSSSSRPPCTCLLLLASTKYVLEICRQSKRTPGPSPLRSVRSLATPQPHQAQTACPRSSSASLISSSSTLNCRSLSPRVS
jgi:hypothetical protein